MEQIDNRYIGFFIRDKKSLWKGLQQLTNTDKKRPWIYITDEHPPHKLKSVLKRKSIKVKHVDRLSSSGFKLREQVVRAKPVTEALEEKIGTTNSDLVIFMEMTWAVRTPSEGIISESCFTLYSSF